MLSEQIAICRRLKNLRFDFGIDLQGHLKTAICLKFSYPKQRIACHATDAFSRMMNPLPEKMPRDAHWVEWQNHVLRKFGEFKLPVRPMMPPAEKPKPRLATISTSAGHPSKVYPADKWLVVAKALQEDGLRVAFLGAAGDPVISMDGAADYVGKLSLAESMAMVSASEIHLAGDTGTGHMAAAYGVPVVSIFGHMDPTNYRPYSERGVVLREGDQASNVPSELVVEAARKLRRSFVA